MPNCYSDLQLAAALRQVGVPAGDAAYLVATAHPESSGCSVIQQGQPYSTTGWGVWQITPGNSEPQFGVNQTLLNLHNNAEAAYAKLKSQGLSAWTTITTGKYVPYFGAAKSAVSTVYNMPLSQVNALAASAPQGPQQAQTTGILSGLGGNLFSGFLNDIANALGLPSPKDMLIRGGLILLGAALVIVALIIMFGKGDSKVSVTVTAPKVRAARTVA